jgi:acyl-CoA hydrolase
LKTRKSDFLTEARTCRESRVIQTHRIFPFDLNPFGYLFGGKLMTLIDDAASIAISRHCRRGAVTASLDNLNFLKPLHDNHSVCVKCYVSGSHNKSMEVFVKVIGEDLATGERYLAATCFTTFVAVPSHMNEEKQFTVPHVVPETDEEKMVCGGYEKRRNHRLKERTEYQNFAALLSTDLPWSDEGTGD